MRVRRLVISGTGRPEFNAGSRMRGQLDTDLSDLGRAQAVAAAEVLAKRQPCSSCPRTCGGPRHRVDPWPSTAGCRCGSTPDCGRPTWVTGGG